MKSIKFQKTLILHRVILYVCPVNPRASSGSQAMTTKKITNIFRNLRKIFGNLPKSHRKSNFSTRCAIKSVPGCSGAASGVWEAFGDSSLRGHAFSSDMNHLKAPKTTLLLQKISEVFRTFPKFGSSEDRKMQNSDAWLTVYSYGQG